MSQHTIKTTQGYSQKYERIMINLKTMLELKTYQTTKIIKSKGQPKSLKHTFISTKFGEHTTQSLKIQK